MLLLGSLAYLLASVVFYMITTQRLPSDAACLKVISPFCEYGLQLLHWINGLSFVGADFAVALGEEAIEYELRNFHDEFASRLLYRGPPTVERESRWDSLTPCKPQWPIHLTLLAATEAFHCSRTAATD